MDEARRLIQSGATPGAPPGIPSTVARRGEAPPGARMRCRLLKGALILKRSIILIVKRRVSACPCSS